MTLPDPRIGIFTVDAHLVVTVWDDTLARATGISRAAASGRPLVELIPDLEARGILTRFRRVIDEGTVEVLVPAFHRYLIRCPPPFPSKYFDAMQQRVTIAPLRGGERIEGAVVTIEDVTERLERERETAAQLASPDEAVRLRAAEALADAERSDSSSALVGALADDSWRVRRAAVDGLAQRVAPDAVAALLGAMREGHHDLGLVNGALSVLRVLDVDVVAPLAEFLESDEVGLSVQAALALGEQRDARAVAPLLRSLDHEDANVRYHAVEALGRLGAVEAAGAIAAIAESRDFFLGFAALEALRAIGDPAVAPRLVPLLDDELLGAPAAEALGRLGDAGVVGALAAALNAGSVPAAVAAGAFAALYDRAEPSDEERTRVADAVRGSVDGAGAGRLVEALETATGDNLRALARTVVWLDGEAADRALVDLLGHEDAAVRQIAVDALGALGRPETAARAARLLDDAEPRVRESAVRVVGAIGGAAHADRIFELCSDPDERVRCAAIEQLAGLDDPRAVPELARVLESDESRARAAAAHALGRIGRGEAGGLLLAALGDADSWVRYFATRSAAEVEIPGLAGELLRLAQTDPAVHVRIAAMEGLGRVGGEEAAAFLSEQTHASDPDVASAAKRALEEIAARTGGGLQGEQE